MVNTESLNFHSVFSFRFNLYSVLVLVGSPPCSTSSDRAIPCASDATFAVPLAGSDCRTFHPQCGKLKNLNENASVVTLLPCSTIWNVLIVSLEHFQIIFIQARYLPYIAHCTHCTSHIIPPFRHLPVESLHLTVSTWHFQLTPELDMRQTRLQKSALCVDSSNTNMIQ